MELELILVNDASPDNGLALALQLQERDPRIKIVDLSKNVGQHRALWLGLRYATGDKVAVLDGDMDEDPLWLIDAHQQMAETDSDMVFGVQSTQRGSMLYRASRAIFYRLLTVMSWTDFPKNVTTCRLMNRRFVDALMQFDEREIFLVGIMHMVGFRQSAMAVAKGGTSVTSYSLSRLAYIFVTHTTSFSIAPLMAVFIAGLLLMCVATVAVIALIGFGLLSSIDVPGWASTAAIIMMSSGLALSFNGIIAVYVGTIFLEVKRRPVAIVKTLYGINGDTKPPAVIRVEPKLELDRHRNG
jgi:putative glycosyltransferase